MGRARSVLQAPAHELARRAREFLQTARYTEEGLLELLHIVESPSVRLRNLPRLLDATREPTALNILARWFLMGVPVEARTASTLIPGWFLEGMAQCGLLADRGGAIASTALLIPFGRLYVASDHSSKADSLESFDYVLTINPAARALLAFTIRRPSDSTLDLCAGCGVQALVAASHSHHVIATDLNPGAIAFAAFNAAINGMENIEFLTGDSFSPVTGRTFDLIVCNPPFILAPSKKYLYRDNDMELDGFCRQLVRTTPGYLNEGGFFQMICEWPEIEGEPWQERISSWFEGTVCDVWVLNDYEQEPSLYIQTRLRETPFVHAGADQSVFDEWVGYFRRNRIRKVHGGLVAMRRRTGANWLRIEELGQKIDVPFGESVLRGFEGRDFLEANPSDEGLLDARLKLAEDVRLEQIYRCDEGHWRTVTIKMRLAEGLQRPIALEGDVAEFLARFDGSRSLRHLVAEVASANGVELARAVPECLKVVRTMIDRGVLVP